VGTDFELFARLLVDVRRAVDREFLEFRRQRDGPRTCAPVLFAVETISLVDASRMRWSNAFRRMRMFWPFMIPISALAE